MHHIRKYIICVLVATVLTSCSHDSGKPYLNLPNGERIEVLGYEIVYTKNQKESVLFLKYQVDSIDNVSRLRSRAEMIWPYFRGVVEEKEMEYGGIMAVQKVKELKIGSVKQYENLRYSLILEKDENGEWNFIGE